MSNNIYLVITKLSIILLLLLIPFNSKNYGYSSSRYKIDIYVNYDEVYTLNLSQYEFDNTFGRRINPDEEYSHYQAEIRIQKIDY